MTSVEITTPDGTHRLGLHTEALTIGRGAANDVALPYSQISRLHAELLFRQGAWWVRDQGSTNGLRVNGQRVLEARLDPSIVVELSPQVTLRLLSDAEAAQAPATPPPARQVAAPTPPTEITPLSAYAPRSPYAEDETPYYPHMRPKPAESKPRPPTPAPAQPPRAPARDTFSNPTFPPMGHASSELTQRNSASGAATTLHICQTCGQRTAPDAVYCQSCHHSIATECPNCRLSLLPIQTICPRCQTPNPGAVKKRKQAPI